MPTVVLISKIPTYLPARWISPYPKTSYPTEKLNLNVKKNEFLDTFFAINLKSLLRLQRVGKYIKLLCKKLRVFSQ